MIVSSSRTRRRHSQIRSPFEVLRAEGERGRRYRAEWIQTGAATDRLDVSVTELSSADE